MLIFLQIFLKLKLHIFSMLACLFTIAMVQAQPVTGFWKGKIDRKNVEVKIIKSGDSITGTSYYYESPNSYRRYSIKGYFDERDNSVVWWDDQLIEEKKGRRLLPAGGDKPYLLSADFNCPGGDKMFLNGDAALKEDEEKRRGPVDLVKFSAPVFNDEWDFVINNYTVGANDPYLIDSIGKLAFNKPSPVIIIPAHKVPAKPKVAVVAAKPTEPASPKVAEVATIPKKPVFIPEQNEVPVTVASMEPKAAQVFATPALTIKEKFTRRRTVVLQEIPLAGDSIELRFYDNAEVDGDSISIFLNNELLYEHVRLSEKAYTVKLAVETLLATNNLVMVAENLGSIPPNTSLMVAMVDGKRYETRLESTEQSSAAIRFVKLAP